MYTHTRDDATSPRMLPTAPHSVVWSSGHCYVLELPDTIGRGCHWIGLDAHGRPLELSPADLHSRGWTLHPS